MFFLLVRLDGSHLRHVFRMAQGILNGCHSPEGAIHRGVLEAIAIR